MVNFIRSLNNDIPYEISDDQLSLALQPSSKSRRKNVRVVKKLIKLDYIDL